MPPSLRRWPRLIGPNAAWERCLSSGDSVVRRSRRSAILFAGFVPGGWRDWWDDPNDQAEQRARAENAERKHMTRAAVLGQVWRAEPTPGRNSGVRTRAGEPSCYRL